MKLFAHTRWDIAPVLAAIAHLLFNIYLVVGFESRPHVRVQHDGLRYDFGQGDVLTVKHLNSVYALAEAASFWDLA